MSITEQSDRRFPTGTLRRRPRPFVGRLRGAVHGHRHVQRHRQRLRRHARRRPPRRRRADREPRDRRTRTCTPTCCRPSSSTPSATPRSSFSTEQAQVDGRASSFEGEITIKGVTQPATLTGTIAGPITDPYGNERYGLQLETTVDRTEFGIIWNADMPDGTKALADEVTLKADLSLVKAA